MLSVVVYNGPPSKSFVENVRRSIILEDHNFRFQSPSKRHLSLSLSRFLLFSEMLERQEKSEPRDGLVEKGNGRRKNVLIVDEQQPQQQKSGGCCGGGGS